MHRTLPPAAPLVIKVGGRELLPGAELDRLVETVAGLVRVRRSIVLVHGGGDEVTDRAAALGLRTTKRAGQRVTSAPMLEVVVEVLAGRISARLVARLGRAGVGAVGVNGASAGLLTVRPMGSPPGSLGYVGRPRRVRDAPVRALLGAGFVPVVAPVGVDRAGQLYNVNADLAAGALASALGAEVWFLTDVAGVRDAAGTIRTTLTTDEVPRLIAEQAATDGMIPKLEAAAAALREGAVSAWVGPLASVGADGPVRGAGTLLLLPDAPSPPAARAPAERARGR